MSNTIDILDVLASLSGNGYIGLDTETVPKLNGGKKNPMLGKVVKRVTGSNCQMFQNKFINGYEAMVRRRLDEEGKDGSTFVLGKRPWGQRLEGLPIVENKGKYYLEVIYKLVGDVEYLLDGQPIAKGDIIGLPEASEGEQGGLSNKVAIRTIELANVKAIRYGGQEYRGEFVVGEL